MSTAAENKCSLCGAELPPNFTAVCSQRCYGLLSSYAIEEARAMLSAQLLENFGEPHAPNGSSFSEDHDKLREQVRKLQGAPGMWWAKI